MDKTVEQLLAEIATLKAEKAANYKKTDRKRVTDEEKAMAATVAAITAATGVKFTYTRSTEQKYARALFDLSCNGQVVRTGLTYSEVMLVLESFSSIQGVVVATILPASEVDGSDCGSENGQPLALAA